MSETTKQVSRGVIAIEDPNNAGEYIPFLIKVRDKEVIWSSNDNIASAGLGYLPYDNTADINKPKLTYHFTTDSGYNVEIYSNGYTIITKLFKFSEFILQTNPAYAITKSSLPILPCFIELKHLILILLHLRFNFKLKLSNMCK